MATTPRLELFDSGLTSIATAIPIRLSSILHRSWAFMVCRSRNSLHIDATGMTMSSSIVLFSERLFPECVTRGMRFWRACR